jgi:hypothetical protein
MTERDIVTALQAAVARADPSWINQPSHLRRRLEEELGTEARQHRAQIHQLVVAAEERVPIRLKRNGWSPSERAELGQVLVNTRGWTPEASDWAVATWAAALNLSDERPQAPSPAVTTVRPKVDHAAGATEVPSDSMPAATELPQLQFPPPTILPPQYAPVATELPSELATRDPMPPAKLPTRGMRRCTGYASKFLGQEVDVAYEVRGWFSPTLTLLILVPIAVSLLAGPAVRIGIRVFVLVLAYASFFWPRRVLAVKDNVVWLLSVKKFTYVGKPKKLLAEGTRDDVEFASDWPIPSVRFAGQRHWFHMATASAARRLPTGSSRPTKADA